MHAHEVPTHVQAEDRVLLWLTFPQIVALTAVSALAYGLYHYAPVGPAEVRIALATLFGAVGVAVVAGRIGGRRLPLVAADLLRYALGPQRYAGPPGELVRSKPPTPVQSPEGREGDPLRLLARRVVRRTRRVRRRRKKGERRNGRRLLRPRLPGRRCGREGREERKQRRGFWKAFLVAAVLALVALTAAPLAALATSPSDGGWSSEEIEFQPPPPIPGRRLFVEGLTASGDRAEVVLRAATDLRLAVRAYGGPEGRWIRYYATASLEQGERRTYDLPLHGPGPALVFSWRDGLGQAGALSLDGERLPWPLSTVEGELCDLRVVSLGWTPGVVKGVIASECVSATAEVIDLQVVAGHADVLVPARLTAEVVSIAGAVTVSSGGSQALVPFVVGGETRFRLPVASGEGVHVLAVEAVLEASLRIPLPPLVQLTYHPERTKEYTKTAVVSTPAYADIVTETVPIPNEDGTFTERTVTASCYIPASTVSRDVVFSVVHEERIEAEVLDWAPIAKTRIGTLAFASSIWSDDAYRALNVPEPEPEPDPVPPIPAGEGELEVWFGELGWEWPW